MSKIAERSHFVGVDVSRDWLDVCVLSASPASPTQVMVSRRQIAMLAGHENTLRTKAVAYDLRPHVDPSQFGLGRIELQSRTWKQVREHSIDKIFVKPVISHSLAAALVASYGLNSIANVLSIAVRQTDLRVSRAA